MGKTTPQMQIPGTEASDRALSQAQHTTSFYGPEMEKFFYGQMMGGGKQNIDKLMADMLTQRDRGQQDAINKVKASGVPMQSTAMSRAMTDELGNVNLQSDIALGQLRSGLLENEMNRRYRAAQGLGNMGNYYAQPSSIEQAIFGMKTPYRMANYQASLADRQAMANWMNQLGMYQPERVQTPSPFQQYVSPVLNPVMEGVGMALPFSLFD